MGVALKKKKRMHRKLAGSGPNLGLRRPSASTFSGTRAPQASLLDDDKAGPEPGHPEHGSGPSGDTFLTHSDSAHGSEHGQFVRRPPGGPQTQGPKCMLVI